MNRDERIKTVNRIMIEIASRGRRFFHHKGTVSRFEWHGRNLWYTDSYGGAFTLKKGSRHKTQKAERCFSEGGTLWGLINDFADFIHGEDNTNGKHGYGGLYCPHWGYPPGEIEAVRQLAKYLGYLKIREEQS